MGMFHELRKSNLILEWFESYEKISLLLIKKNVWPLA